MRMTKQKEIEEEDSVIEIPEEIQCFDDVMYQKALEYIQSHRNIKSNNHRNE